MSETCPRCGDELSFDEVDIGVGVQQGNPGCGSCHWTPDAPPADMTPTQWLAPAWDFYREQAYPDGLSVLQELETKRAFYSGAHAFCAVVLLAQAAPDPVAVVQEMMLELEAFLEKLKAGRA